MKSLIYILLFLSQIVNTIYCKATAKEFVIRSWGLGEGIKTDRVLGIESDKDGFLWLATDNGLSRFDGFQFITFDQKNSNFIKNNYIANIFKDKENNLYCTGASDYLVKIERTALTECCFDTLLAKNIIFRKTFFFDNKTWILSHKGVFLLENDKIIFQKLFNGIPSSKISAVATDKAGNLWIAIDNKGIYRFNAITNKFKLIYSLKNKNIRRFFFDSRDRIWISSKEGVIVFKNGKRITDRNINKISQKLLRDLKEDKFGNIWLATSRSGLFLLDNKNRLIRITKKDGLSDESITNIKIIDEDVWIGTLNGGLNLINRAKLRVVDKSLGLFNQYTNSFFNDKKGSILIGTTKGIFKVRDDYNDFGKAIKLPFLNDKHVYVMNQDKDGNLLVGTRLFGFYILQKDKIINYNKSNKLKSDFVRAIYVDENNRIYVGTNTGGIAIFSADTVKYITRKDGLSNELIAFIHRAKDGRLWVGTSGGGINILSNDKVVKIIDKKSGLKGNVVSSIEEDSNGVIWLSINGGGLTRIEGDSIKCFTTADGLFTDKLLNIVSDKYNRFWFTTPSGVFSINKNDITKYLNGEISLIGYKLYGKAEGMPVERCTGASKQTAIISANGNLFVSTSAGAVVINTKTIKPAKNKIKMVIDKITVDDKTICPEKYMSLPKDFKKIEFSFAAINFKTPNYLRVYYKLNGIDSDWREAGKNRSVSYSYIPFGVYKFEVKTNNTSENQKIEQAQVVVSIPPHFWEVRLFQVMVFILFVLAVIGITKYINTQKYKRKLRLLELEQALEKERIRISKDMHDEVGANLTKMSLLGEIAKKYTNGNKKLSEYLNQITTTGIEVASSLDELVWTVNPKNDRLSRLIAYVIQFVEDFLSSTEIKFTFSLPESIPETYISAELRHSIFSVIKEAINNSVKHSECTKINLVISIEEKDLCVGIEDNGVGYNPDSIGEFSNGMNNMRSRIESVKGNFKLYKVKPSGTGISFTVRI